MFNVLQNPSFLQSAESYDVKQAQKEETTIVVSPTDTTSQEKAQEEKIKDLRLELCDYVSDNSDVILTVEEVLEESPDANGYTHYKLTKTPPKQPTSINKEEVDKDTLIAQQAATIKLLETSRIMIHTALQADADEQIKNHKQQLVNDAKKTLEKSKTPTINGAKKNLAKTFKDSEAKGKKTRKPAAKKQKQEPIAPIDVAQDVPMTEMESDGKIIQEAEVKKWEIEPRSDNPYCFPNDTITPKELREDGKDFLIDIIDDTIIMITNHQKEVGKMGDFMMLLDSGVTLWATAAQAKKDCKEYECEHLLNEYMNQYNVTYEMMGIVQKKRKQKDISISTDNDDIPNVCLPCDSLHDKFICFKDEGVAAYANENQFYGGVMCRGGCGRHFCNKLTKLMVAGKRYNNISFDSVLFLL